MFDPDQWPDRLNLGCGWYHRPGYLNVDLHEFHNPDLVADVTDLAMLPDGRYREIIAQDLLEHLPRTSTVAVLAEWNRLLAVDGVLTLRVPSLFDAVALFSRPENLRPATQEHMLQCIFGTQAYTGDYHYTSFTEPLLRHYLDQEGFTVSRWALKDEWLFDVDAVKVRASDYPQRWAPYADLLATADPGVFLDAAYRQILGREPDPAGLAWFSGQLAAGELTFREVITTLETSEEASAR